MLRWNSLSAPFNHSSQESGAKRKSLGDDPCQILEDNIKRFRITNTPGEIRLNKDMKEVKEMSGISCELADIPECVYLTFERSEFGNGAVPCRFMVKVSKYYPHTKPTVIVLENQFRGICTTEEGEVMHPLLHERWSALNSLRIVVLVLDGMRGQLQFTHFTQNQSTMSNGDANYMGTPMSEKKTAISNDMVFSPSSAAVDAEYLVMEH